MRFIIGIIIICFLGVLGCSDDSEIASLPDTIAPTLSIDPSLDLTKSIFGQVEFQVMASDDSGISGIDFLVDNTVLSSTIEADHIFLFDTNLISDGAHVVEIRVIDTSGNTTVKEYTIAVRNALYRFSVGHSYVNSPRRKWIYVSDVNGKVVDVKELSNSTVTEFPIPQGHTQESNYSFTLVDYLKTSLYNQVTLATMVDVKPDDYLLDVIVTFSQKDRHYLKINNVDASTVVAAGSLGDRVLFTSLAKDELSNSVKITTTLSNEGVHDLIYYVYHATDEPKYLKVDGVINEETTEVELINFLPMSKHTIAVPGAQASYHQISYYVDPSDYFNTSSTGIHYSEDPEQITLYYPENNYQLFTTQLGVTTGDIKYTFSKTSSEIATNFEYLQASIEGFSQENNVIRGFTRGDYDYSRFVAAKTTSTPGELSIFNSITMMNSEEIEFIVTVVPDEIVEIITGLADYEPQFDRIVFYEYSAMNGFDGFIDYRFKNNISLEAGSEKGLTKEILLN